MLSKIKDIITRQILNSRGVPTIETDILLESGAFGRAAYPSRKFLGGNEYLEIQDNNLNIFSGKSVHSAIKNIEKKVKEIIIGIDAMDQKLIDGKMTSIHEIDKKKLGINTILPISLACARAAASHKRKPLFKYLMESKKYIMPLPMIKMISGKVENNNTDFEEIMIIPVKFDKFSDALRCGTEIFYCLEKIFKESNIKNIGESYSDGFIPAFNSNEQAIELILKAIEKSGYKAGDEVFLSLNLGSPQFVNDDKKYFIKSEKNSYETKEFIKKIEEWVKKYPIISIEDALSPEDLEGWKLLTKKMGKKVQLVGNHVFDSSKKFIEGIKSNIANSAIINLNNIGTLSKTFEMMTNAAESGYMCIISEGLGETEDPIISDIAVASGTGQIKPGILSGIERLSSYNQLLRIEEELMNDAIYPGMKAFNFSGIN